MFLNCFALVLLCVNPTSTLRGADLGGGAGVIGNDSDGTFSRNIDDAQIHGNRFQAPVNMQITELRARVLEITGTFKAAVYSDAAGVADRLLRSSVGVVDATNGWNTFPLTAPFDLVGGDFYWLVIWADTPGARVVADTFGTYSLGSYSFPTLAGEFPDPIILTIGTGDAAERTYCIYAEGAPIGTAVGPEMDLRGNGKLIVSGDLSPSALDGTYFGTFSVGSGFQDSTFTIQNVGNAPLALTGTPLVSITGPEAGDFIVTSLPISPIAPGGTATFTVRFDPSARGLRKATVSVASDDSNENPYTFSVQGGGVAGGRESLFPDTKVLGDINFDDTYYELGTVFRASLPGKITHLRVYSLASESGDHTARLWRNSDDTVIGGPYIWNYGGVTGWIEFDIPDVDIAADTDYTVSISTEPSENFINYPNQSDLAAGGNNGLHLSYPVDAGKFTETRDARPTSSFNHGDYGRDIVFVPGTEAGDTTYGFEDVTDDFFILDGLHGGIDFGTGAWVGYLNLAGLNQTGGSEGLAGVFTLPAGKVLKAIRVSSASGGTWRISDEVNPERTGTFAAAATPVWVITDWQMAAANVTLEAGSAAGDAFIDDITYGDASGITPVRIVQISANRATGDVSLRWDGGQDRFQVLKSTTVEGPFLPVSGLISVREFTDVGALLGGETERCVAAPGGAAWFNRPMANQTDTFTVQFDATPSAVPIDSVMAFSSGSQTTFGGLACLARFNTDGNIDARNGGIYAATSVIPYSANVKYSFRLVVNIPAHIYSVFVTPSGGGEQTVGADFAFRTEQNTVTNLNNWAVTTVSATGTNTVCDFTDGTAPQAINQSFYRVRNW